MSTKTINTRIGLKYDSYSNWTQKGTWSDGVFTPDANGTSTYWAEFEPLAGEVVFFSIPQATDDVSQAPAILFKVGDGNTTLENLPWGSAIAADVYAWAKQQSLLGGTETTTGWTWSTDSAYEQEQKEVAAFIKKETANIKVRVDQVTTVNFKTIYKVEYDSTNNEHVGKIGKYQTSVSTDGGVTYTASGDPFAMDVTDYSAGNGLNLTDNAFSIKLKTGENVDSNLEVDETGLSAKVATVTYTAASTTDEGTTSANLTANGTGLLDETAVGAIKSYVDAKAAESNTYSDVTLSTQDTAESGFLSTYVLSQGGVEVGKINIPKDFLVKSATLVENPDGQPAGKYIKFIINSKDDQSGTGEPLYLNVTDLCDVYTANNQTGYVTLAINNNNITATAKTQLISGALGRTYTFTSHSAETGGEDYSTGTVEVVKVENGKTYVKVIENNPDTDFVGNVYYVNSVFGTGLPTERLQLNDNSGSINVWVKLTGVDGSDVDGLATALDVKRYVGEQLAANVPNVEGEGAIVVDDTTGTTSKTVSLKLNNENGHVSGLKQSDAGLEIDDQIEWILNCGGAPTTNNSNNDPEQV